MAVQYETGHAKNVANLQKLIERIKTYSNYNPSIDNLKISEVEALYNKSIVSLNNIKDKRVANKEAIYKRQELYKNLKSKSTRVINLLDILSLKDGTFSHAKSLNKLIQGNNKSIKKEDTYSEDETKSISKSRQSYTEVAENFSKLVQLLETINTYIPNTEDLKTENLKIYHKNLVNITTEVNKTEAELKTELITRNKILYNKENGLYEIAQNIKKYIKSLFGAKSPQYSNISRIIFKDF